MPVSYARPVHSCLSYEQDSHNLLRLRMLYQSGLISNKVFSEADESVLGLLPRCF